VLQPDGLFLASMFAGDTAQEMRRACQLADEERLGGFSNRTSPLIHVWPLHYPMSHACIPARSDVSSTEDLGASVDGLWVCKRFEPQAVPVPHA
jgi:hypothetical protein